MTEDSTSLKTNRNFNFSENTKVLPWINQEFFETVIREYTKNSNAEVGDIFIRRNYF